MSIEIEAAEEFIVGNFYSILYQEDFGSEKQLICIYIGYDKGHAEFIDLNTGILHTKFTRENSVINLLPPCKIKYKPNKKEN